MAHGAVGPVLQDHRVYRAHGVAPWFGASGDLDAAAARRNGRGNVHHRGSRGRAIARRFRAVQASGLDGRRPSAAGPTPGAAARSCGAYPAVRWGAAGARPRRGLVAAGAARPILRRAQVGRQCRGGGPARVRGAVPPLLGAHAGRALRGARHAGRRFRVRGIEPRPRAGDRPSTTVAVFVASGESVERGLGARGATATKRGRAPAGCGAGRGARRCGGSPGATSE